LQESRTRGECTMQKHMEFILFLRRAQRVARINRGVWPMHAVPIKSDVATAISAGQEVPSNEFLLLRELSHRISNEFASAIGYVSAIASRSTSEDARLALTGVADLLHHYADVH